MILSGYPQPYPQPFYIAGATALLITAMHYKLVFFIALEVIIVTAHSAMVLGGVGPYIQVALPILLCFQLYVFFLMVGKENNLLLLIGIIGIALLSIGLSHNDNWIFLTGSMCITTYSLYSALKVSPASYIWAFLNGAFAVIALYNIML